MPMIKIKKLAFDHVQKATKGEFHQSVLSILENEGVDTLLPEKLLAEYRENIAHYPKLNGVYAADELTGDMARLDAARDAAYRVISTALEAMTESIDPEVARYYDEHVRPVFTAFRDFSPRMDYAEETARLRSFCKRLKDLDFGMLSRAYVTEAQVDDLNGLNERFEALYTKRNVKRSQRESPAALARIMEEQWDLIAAFITARANEDATDATSGTVARFQHAAATLNEHIDYYRQNYIRRGVRK